MKAINLFIASIESSLMDNCDNEDQEIAQLCFEYHGMQIHDSLRSENGFESVDAAYYGLTETQRTDIVASNEAIARYVTQSTDEMAEVIQKALNITDGDVAGQTYQGELLAQHSLIASTLMANHALAEISLKWID